MQAHTGKKYIRDYEQEYYERCKELNANVYITVGDEEDTGFVSGIESFEKSLEERNYDDLNIIYEIIEDYGHDTVFKPSIRNALKIFYGRSDVDRQIQYNNGDEKKYFNPAAVERTLVYALDVEEIAGKRKQPK